ncbi:MAG TPA: restriction endonuclease subunit S, partial [Lentisphaeria bacterium]|nr:restriction endonuclease subunit S [Lentisphaeria bacterium]
KKIKAEKDKLVKEGKIRPEKPLPALLHDKMPYLIPGNWKWVKLGETVLQNIGGGTPSKNNSLYWDGDIPWASVKDVGKDKYLTSTQDFITKDGLKNSSSNLIPAGQLIVVTRMGLGKVSINKIDVAINQDLRALFLSSKSVLDYYYIFFLTHKFEGTGLTVKGIKQDELMAFPFPLPPLSEQKRIVAKVDELMALCDELEAANEIRDEKRKRLNWTSLKAVTDAKTPEDFKKASGFFINHLPEITVTQDHIKNLRQLILDLAVRGKLVPQDPKDEPASELLKKIKAEKDKLVKIGKIRKESNSTQIYPDVILFELPGNWQWCRLTQIANVGTGATPLTTESLYYNGEINWITSGDTGNPFITEAETKITSKAIQETNCKVYPINTLVIAMYGQGKTRGQITELKIEAATNQACAAISLYIFKDQMNQYVKYYFRKMYDEIRILAQGGAQPNLNMEKIKSTMIPLPPLAEQKRIVAKVNELMSLCDDLEKQISISSTQSTRLLNSILQGPLC